MAKQKTRKCATSRLKISGTGKVMAFRAGKRHLNYHKSGNEIRGKGVSFVLDECEAKRARQMMPYGDR